jgi:hypothetical protein
VVVTHESYSRRIKQISTYLNKQKMIVYKEAKKGTQHIEAIKKDVTPVQYIGHETHPSVTAVPLLFSHLKSKSNRTRILFLN